LVALSIFIAYGVLLPRLLRDSVVELPFWPALVTIWMSFALYPSR
jgi:hypothetical protein